jgi:myo-inositol 2-dehydrogenase / D-chiro-inositol 1-dehydrogenase
MNNINQPQDVVTRRHFLKNTSLAIAGTAIAPYVITGQAAGSDLQIKVGLIGCGGRGSGALENIKKADPNVQILAVADVFKDRAEQRAKQFGIPAERTFDGFDAYKKVLAISDINYVILATPPGFRPVHFPAAIAAGKHVFMEKPVAVDSAGIRAVFAAGEAAVQKKLCVVAGTQRRHQKGYVETIKRLQDGAIGEILCLRGYWNQGPIWNNPWKDGVSDMENQLRNWYHYLWLCGDHICEQHVHNIDVCNWVMNDHPIRAYGRGARQLLTGRGMIYDHFSVEYEYKNGTRMFSQCRQIDGCWNSVSEAVVGTKGTSNPGGSLRVTGGEEWRAPGGGKDPYVQEHIDLIAAIRSGEYVNETKNVANSTLTAIMGRESAYTGEALDWDTILNAKFSIMPEKLEFGQAPPAEVPVPGKYKLT